VSKLQIGQIRRWLVLPTPSWLGRPHCADGLRFRVTVVSDEEDGSGGDYLDGVKAGFVRASTDFIEQFSVVEEEAQPTGGAP